MLFIDGELITVDKETGDATYRYKFDEDIEEGQIIPLLFISSIPDEEFLHSFFRTEVPRNSSINQLYERIRKKEEQVRREEHIRQKRAQFGGVGTQQEQWDRALRDIVLLCSRETTLQNSVFPRRTGSKELVGDDQLAVPNFHDQTLTSIRLIRNELDRMENKMTSNLYLLVFVASPSFQATLVISYYPQIYVYPKAGRVNLLLYISEHVHGHISRIRH